MGAGPTPLPRSPSRTPSVVGEEKDVLFMKALVRIVIEPNGMPDTFGAAWSSGGGRLLPDVQRALIVVLILLLLLMAIPLGMGLALGSCPSGMGLCPMAMGLCALLLALGTLGSLMSFGFPIGWAHVMRPVMLANRLDRPPRV
jgi:hypothetical protein